MPVLEPLKPFFDGMMAASGAPDERPPAEARATMHAMIETSFNAFCEQPPPLPSETDHDVAVDGGAIIVRVYRPKAGADPLPCHLYLHGGGFWLGTLDHSNATCRALARDAGCVVASVDYRLAPEYRFPTAPEDCYAALLWVVAQAEALGVDPARISVGGGSAGGNLAAVVALMARDRRGPRLALQVLEIPVLDFTRLEPLTIPSEGLVVPSGKAQYGAYYLDASQAKLPYASPQHAPSLEGLPPALVMCAEYDPLRPEGEAYVERLKAAGVPVVYRCWKGQFHGSQHMSLLIPEEASAYQAELARALQDAYANV